MPTVAFAYAFALAALLAPPAEGATLERLVARLGAKNWHQREAAAEDIRRVGHHAADALTRALKHPDAEVRHRARALLDELRWRPPTGLPPLLAAALKHYADLPEDRRSSTLVQMANAVAERAVPFLRKALRHDPSLSVRHTALERLARLDLRAAESDLRAVADQPRFRAWAATALGDLLARANRTDDAIVAYEKARKADPTDAGTLSALAGLYERKADWRKAITAYTALIAAKPRETGYRIKLGWAHYRLGEKPKADAIWRDALARAGHSRRAFMLVAHTYEQAGAKTKALEILRQGCAIHKADFELRRRLANALLYAGRAAEAVEAFHQAAARAPTEYQRQAITRELGRALRRSGRLEAYVERENRELAQLDRQIAALMHALARRRLADGRRDEARRLLERLTKLYPKSEEARRAAKTLAELGQKP